MSKKILFSTIFVLGLFTLLPIVTAEEMVWNLPSQIEHGGRLWDKIWNKVIPVKHPYLQDQNATAYCYLYRDNSTSGFPESLIGIAVLELPMNIMDFNLSSIPGFTKPSGFTGDTVWQLLVYLINQKDPTIITNSSTTWQPWTAGMLLNVTGYEIGLAYYKQYILVGILLENVTQWIQYLYQTGAFGTNYHNLVQKIMDILAELAGKYGDKLKYLSIGSAPPQAAQVTLNMEIPQEALSMVMSGLGTNLVSSVFSTSDGGGFDISKLLGDLPSFSPLITLAVMTLSIVFVSRKLKAHN